MGRYKGRTGSTGINCGGEMKWDHKKIKVNIRKCKFYLEKYPKKRRVITTVEPHSTDTRLIRTPRYYGQFRWSRRKPHTFSLKLTRLIRTPVNTDNGHFSVSRVTNSYTLSTPLYGHYLSVHCEFSLSRLFANLKTLDPGQIMTILLQREAFKIA